MTATFSTLQYFSAAIRPFRRVAITHQLEFGIAARASNPGETRQKAVSVSSVNVLMVDLEL